MKTYSVIPNNKTFLATFMCTMFVAAMVASSNSITPYAYAQNSGATDWDEYSNSYMGVEVKYPHDWFRDTEFLNYMYDITFFSKYESDQDEYDERVILAVEKIPESVTLDDYGDAVLKSLQTESEFSIVSQSSDESLSGHVARSIVYTSYAQEGNLDLKSRITWTVLENRAYVLQAYALRDAYDDYVDIFDGIFDSFKITDTSPPDPTVSYTTYTTPDDLFAIEYPDSWYLATQNEELPSSESVVAIYSPWHGYMFDGATMGVDLVDVGSGTDLEEYSQGVIQDLERSLDGFDLLESSDSKLSEQTAHHITYTWQNEGKTIRTDEVWALVGSNAYHVFASVEDAIFEDYRPSITHTLETFKFLSAAGTGTTDTGGDKYVPGSGEYLLYENSDYGIKIKYPEEWVKLEPENVAAVFTAPADGPADIFYENMIVGVSDSPIKISLEEFTKLNIASLKSSVNDFVVLESKPGTLDGHSAHYIIGAGSTEGGDAVKLYAIWTVVENRQFFLLFTGAEKSYDEYSSVRQYMVSSFEIDEAKLETGYSIYVSKALGMKVQYPSNWKVEENSGYDELTSVTFSDESQYRYFSMNAHPIVLDLTLEEYSKAIPEMLSQKDKTFRLVESSPTELAGHPAYKIVYTNFLDIPDKQTPEVQPVAYTNTADSIQVKSAIYTTMIDGIVYNAVFGSTATDYLNFIGTANRIVDSVEIDPSTVSTRIPGKFADPASSLSFEVPAGWTGYHTSLGNVTAVGLFRDTHSSQADMKGALIWIRVENLTAKVEQDDKVDENSIECKTQKESYVIQATANLQMAWIPLECTFYGVDAIMKSYYLYTTEDYITITLIANDKESFDRSLPELEKVVKTVEVEKAINAFNSDTYDDLFGVTSFNQTITAKDTVQTVHFSTKSNVTDIVFDEENKTLSFKVTGKTGTNGYTSVVVSHILEAPYLVTLDGKPTEEYRLLYDQVDNETSVSLDYSHSAHDITISGATVVPEFTYPMILSALIGTAIFASFIYRRQYRQGP